jgi:hypothetical protein
MGVDEKKLRCPEGSDSVKSVLQTPPSYTPPISSNNSTHSLSRLFITFGLLAYSERSSVCGVLGLLLHDPSIDAATEISEGLALLQHRGQDACGIITCGPKGRFFQCKANGMVRDVFDEKSLSRLVGGMGVGHGELNQVSFLFF